MPGPDTVGEGGFCVAEQVQRNDSFRAGTLAGSCVRARTWMRVRARTCTRLPYPLQDPPSKKKKKPLWSFLQLEPSITGFLGGGFVGEFLTRPVSPPPASPPLPSRLPPPTSLALFFFFPSFVCSHLANSASTPVIFYCVEVISTLSAKWKHMMCAGFGLNGVGLAWSSTDTQPHRRAAAKTASPWNASCPLLHWR